jgi:small subunit ribosomal protein S20
VAIYVSRLVDQVASRALWAAERLVALLVRLRFFEVVVPRIKSAKKRMRQAKTHTTLNRTHRSQLRSAIKKVRTAAAGAAQAAYDEAVKLIDRAGRKRLIHPNAAARQKSRLSKLAKAGGAK